MYQTGTDNKFQVNFAYFPQKSKEILKIQNQLEQISLKDLSVRSSIQNLKKKLNMAQDSFDLSQSISVIQNCRNCHTLKKKIQKLKKQYYPLHQEMKILAFQNSKINKQKNKLKEKVKDLQQQLQKRKYQTQRQTQKQNKLLIEYKIKDMQCLALMKQNKQFVNTVQKLRTEISTLKRQLDINEQVSNQRSSSINIQLKLKIDNYMEELKQKQRQIQNQKKYYQKKFLDQEDEFAKIQQNFNVITQSFQKQLDEKQSVIELINRSVKTQSNNFNQEVKRRQEIEIQLSKLKVQNSKIKDEIIEINNNNQYLKHLINNYQVQISDHQKFAFDNQQKLKKASERQKNGILQQLNQFRMVIDQTQKSQFQYNRIIEELQAKIKDQAIEKQKIISQFQQLEDTLFKTNLQKQSLISKYNQLQKQSNLNEKRTNDLKKEIQSKRSSIKQKDVQIQQYMKQLNQKQNIIVSLQVTLERHDHESLNQRKVLQKQLQLKDVILKQKEEKFIQIQYVNQKLQLQKVQNEKIIYEEKKQRENQIQIKNKLVNQLAQLQDQLSTKSQQHEKLKYKVQALEQKKINFSQQIQKLNTANKAQYNTIQDLNRKLTLISGQKTKIQQKQNILQHQRKILQKELQSYKSTIQTLKTVQNLKEDKSKQQFINKIQDLNSQINQYKLKVVDIQKVKNKQLELKHGLIQTLNANITEINKEKEQIKIKLSKELTQRQKKIEQLDKLKNQSILKFQDVVGINKKLAIKMSQKEAEANTLIKQYQQSKRSIQLLRQENSKQSSQNIKMLHSLHNLEDQYTKLSQSKQNFIQTLKEQNQKLHQQKLELFAQYQQLKSQSNPQRYNKQSSTTMNSYKIEQDKLEQIKRLTQKINEIQKNNQKLTNKNKQLQVYYENQIKSYKEQIYNLNQQINRLTQQLFQFEGLQQVTSSQNAIIGRSQDIEDNLNIIGRSQDIDDNLNSQLIQLKNIQRAQSIFVPLHQTKQISFQIQKNKDQIIENNQNIKKQSRIQISFAEQDNCNTSIQQPTIIEYEPQNIEQLKMTIFKLNQQEVQLSQKLQEQKKINQSLFTDNARLFQDNKNFFQQRALMFKDVEYLRQKEAELLIANKVNEQKNKKIQELSLQIANLSKQVQEMNEEEELLKIQCINFKIKIEELQKYKQNKQLIESKYEIQVANRVQTLKQRQEQNQSQSKLAKDELSQKMVHIQQKQIELNKKENSINEAYALSKIKQNELIKLQLKLEQDQTNMALFQKKLKQQQQINKKLENDLNDLKKELQDKEKIIRQKKKENMQKELSLNQNFNNIKLLLQQIQSKGQTIQKIKDAKKRKEQKLVKQYEKQKQNQSEDTFQQTFKKLSQKLKSFILVRSVEKQRKKSEKIEQIQNLEHSQKIKELLQDQNDKKQNQQLQQLLDQMHERPQTAVCQKRQQLFVYLFDLIYQQSINFKQVQIKTVYDSIRELINILKQVVIQNIQKQKENVEIIIKNLREALKQFMLKQHPIQKQEHEVVVPFLQQSNKIEMLNLDFESKSPVHKFSSSEIRTDRQHPKTHAKFTYSQINSDRHNQQIFDQKSEEPIEDIVKKKQKSILMIQDINQAINMQEERQEQSRRSNSNKNSLKGSMELKNQSLQLNSKKQKSSYETPTKQQHQRDYYSQAPGMASKISNQSRKQIEQRYKSNMKNTKLLNKLKTKSKKR